MTELLLIGAAVLVLFGLFGVVYIAARSAAEAEAARAQAEKESADARKTSKVLAEHRTTDDAVKRLSDGTF